MGHRSQDQKATEYAPLDQPALSVRLRLHEEDSVLTEEQQTAKLRGLMVIALQGWAQSTDRPPSAVRQARLCGSRLRPVGASRLDRYLRGV